MAKTAFDMTEDQRMLTDSVRRLLADGSDNREKRLALDGLGILEATQPEELGGAGMRLEDIAPVFQEMGRQASTVPFLGTILAGLALERANTASVAGIANALTKPCALAICAARRGTLKPNDDGWVLSPDLPLTFDAELEGTLLIAIADDEVGEQLCLVGLPNDDVEIKPVNFVDGRQCSDVKLTSTKLKPEAVLELPTGSCIALADIGAVALAADALGALEAIRDMTQDYLQTRKQFGLPLASHQVLQHGVVDIFHDVEDLRSLVHLSAKTCSETDEPMRQRAVSSLKRMITTRVRRSATSAIQMHGGIGVTEEYPLGRYLKRIIVADMMFGSAERHSRRLAGIIAEDARKLVGKESET